MTKRPKAKTVTVQAIVPHSVAKKLWREAERTGRSLSSVIARRLIKSFQPKEK